MESQSARPEGRLRSFFGRDSFDPLLTIGQVRGVARFHAPRDARVVPMKSTERSPPSPSRSQMITMQCLFYLSLAVTLEVLVGASTRLRDPGQPAQHTKAPGFGISSRALTQNRFLCAGSERLTVRSFFDSSLTTTSTAEGWYACDPERTETIAKRESFPPFARRARLLRRRRPPTPEKEKLKKISCASSLHSKRQAVHLRVRVRGGPGRLLPVRGGRAREEVPGLRRDRVPGALRRLLRGGWRSKRRRLVGHHRRRRRRHHGAGGVLVRVEGDAGHPRGPRREVRRVAFATSRLMDTSPIYRCDTHPGSRRNAAEGTSPPRRRTRRRRFRREKNAARRGAARPQLRLAAPASSSAFGLRTPSC